MTKYIESLDSAKTNIEKMIDEGFEKVKSGESIPKDQLEYKINGHELKFMRFKDILNLKKQRAD